MFDRYPDTWFISDPHLGHKNILKYEPNFRPFKDTNEMDETIINNFNDTVKEGDTVFWLGDMFFCNASRMDYIMSRLKPTRNILIRGNHDKGVTNSKFLRLGFEPHRMYLYDDEFLLTHEPISEANLKTIQYYYGEHIKNVHGHTHSDQTGLDPRNWQCVSLELIDFKPISDSKLFWRFME
jgi:calcineurin-like phosphoesterase family protein